MLFDNIKQGEVNFLQVAHDNNCPTIRTWDMGDCKCRAIEMSFHQDQSKYERDFNNAVQMNREARREMERAMRKAAGKTKAARATGAASKGAPTVNRNSSTRQKKGGSL